MSEEQQPCLRCGEPVLPDDGFKCVCVTSVDGDGVEIRAQHWECQMRAVVGSVGHQRGLCSCNGGPGTLDDPPEMTVREAARAAVAEYEKKRGGR